MSTTQYRVTGADHGIPGHDAVITIPTQVDGKGINDFPRNEMEQKMLDSVLDALTEKAGVNKSKLNPDGGTYAGQGPQPDEAEQVVQGFEESRIKDPIRTDLNLSEAIAEQSPLGLGTAFEEFKNIMPGGDTFRPDIMTQSIQDYFLRKMPDDPKRAMGDMAVIASDLFLMGLSIGNVKFAGKKNFNIPLFTNESRRAGLRGFAERNPVKSTVAANVAARVGSDALYDSMNEIYRYLNGIDPDQSDDPAVENILNARNELLWSGGAGGLAKLFPYIKPFIGKTFLGVKDADRLATMGRLNGVPMSVFNVSESGLVQSLPGTIGLFPIVAGRARQIQNAQMSAAYKNVINVMDEISPVTLLADAGLLIDKGFRKTVSDFSTMKGALFANANKYAKALDQEAFIPTKKIQELANGVRQAIEGRQIKVEARPIGESSQYYYGDKVPLDELLKGISGKEDELAKGLAMLDGLPDYLNANQYMGLIQKLNSVKRNLPELRLDSASDEALMLNDFHVEAIRVLNDPASWNLSPNAVSSGTREMAEQFSAAYSLANDFFFKNADTIKGRSSMLLKQTDPNIDIAGAPNVPGLLFADQMAKIFLNDNTVLSPMALKEMRKAVGDDAFFAASRTFFDDIIKNNTEFVSGKIRVPTEAASIWQRAKAKVTGKPIAKKFQTIEYNIPVMDIKKIKEGFGLGDINRRQGIEEIFDAKGYNGKQMLGKLDELFELTEAVMKPNFGDVSSFVKRRGFLGGIGSIANLFTGGALLADPISSAGLMLMGRFGMTSLADPKFLDGMTKVMDPTLGDVARKSALVTLGRSVFDPERAVEEGYDINEIGDIIELITLGEMSQSPAYNTRGAEAEQAAASAKAGAGVPMDQVQVAKDPFLDPINIPAMEMPDMSVAKAPTQLNPEQKVAMATGDLDSAIALRGSGNKGLGSLRRTA